MTLVEILAVGFPKSTLDQRTRAAAYAYKAVNQVIGKQLNDAVFSKWSGARPEMSIDRQIACGMKLLKLKIAFNRIVYMTNGRIAA